MRVYVQAKKPMPRQVKAEPLALATFSDDDSFGSSRALLTF